MLFMSINISPADEAARHTVVIAAPRTSDAISGALRTAFGVRCDAEDFALLLRQIDNADLKSGRC